MDNERRLWRLGTMRTNRRHKSREFVDGGGPLERILVQTLTLAVG
jgi:hypothetical protein